MIEIPRNEADVGESVHEETRDFSQGQGIGKEGFHLYPVPAIE